MSLQRLLYREILQKKNELEQLRRNGADVRAEWDLPCMAVACEFADVKRCGFSKHGRHVSRPDIISPFDPLLERELMAQAPGVPKLPYVIFQKKKQLIGVNPLTGEKSYKKVVDKFVGTCAEDNAANSLLYNLIPVQKPASLKQIVFVHPIRTRTLKRERMCGVCQALFTEP